MSRRDSYLESCFWRPFYDSNGVSVLECIHLLPLPRDWKNALTCREGQKWCFYELLQVPHLLQVLLTSFPRQFGFQVLQPSYWACEILDGRLFGENIHFWSAHHVRGWHLVVDDAFARRQELGNSILRLLVSEPYLFLFGTHYVHSRNVRTCSLNGMNLEGERDKERCGG